VSITFAREIGLCRTDFVRTKIQSNIRSFSGMLGGGKVGIGGESRDRAELAHRRLQPLGHSSLGKSQSSGCWNSNLFDPSCSARQPAFLNRFHLPGVGGSNSARPDRVSRRGFRLSTVRVEVIRRRLRIVSRIAFDFARHHERHDSLPHRIAKGFAATAERVDVRAQAQSRDNLQSTVGKRALRGCLQHRMSRCGHMLARRAGRKRQHNNQPFQETFPFRRR
jgi:hypothetical protein